MLSVINKSIFSPLEVFNREWIKGKLPASIVTVVSTALLGSVIAPLVVDYVNRDNFEISLNAGSMALELVASILTWLAVCAVFWAISKALKKEVEFSQITSTWGLSYVPNFLAIMLYRLLQVSPNLNNGSGLAAFILSSLFIMFLVWKAIFYFLLLKSVIRTDLRELVIITLISAFAILLLMTAGFKIGIQVPMI